MNSRFRIWIFAITVPLICLAALAVAIFLFTDMTGLEALDKAVWKAERKIILSESYSPDSTDKVGAYHYDAGNLGFTAIQVSLVRSSEAYPLKANLYSADNIPAKTEWSGDSSLAIVLHGDYRKSAGIRSLPNDTVTGNVHVTYSFKTSEKP